VLAHLRIGLSTGACTGGCVKVFEAATARAEVQNVALSPQD
jgi:hypothetical protein